MASPAQKSVSSCTQDSIEYEHLLQTDKDCTSCQCFDGKVLCTSLPSCDAVNKNIQKTLKNGCTYAGGVYEHLDTFRDNCNACTCFNGAISCTGDSFLLKKRFAKKRWISHKKLCFKDPIHCFYLHFCQSSQLLNLKEFPEFLDLIQLDLQDLPAFQELPET